jgi:hypothetical protein
MFIHDFILSVSQEAGKQVMLYTMAAYFFATHARVRLAFDSCHTNRVLASRPRRDSKFNAKITGVLFCLFGLWPKIQATCFAGGR